jgi:hypothetical protein
MTQREKPDLGHPDVERELMLEGAHPTEITPSAVGKAVLLAQISGTCTAPVQPHKKSRMDCVTAGWYVEPSVTPEEIEHPALRTKRHLH